MIILESVFYSEDKFSLTANWSIAKARFVAVLGASGAGKSTLLSLISGFLRPTQGRIILQGADATVSRPSQRPVSVVFQDNNTFAHLDLFSNVALGLNPSLRLSESQKQQVEQALQRVDLADLKHRLPGAVSGGELQRVALARVLVQDRPILLLDEAFAGLGPGKRHEMLSLVHDLHRETNLTTVMVTHQPEDARAFADDIVFIANGIARGPISAPSFFSSPADKDVREYLGTWR